jgi:hypothetical protein
VGFELGSPRQLSRTVYEGRAQIQPHKYVPDGSYLIIPTKDGKRAVVVEIYEGKVMEIRGGTRPAVDHVEGCL